MAVAAISYIVTRLRSLGYKPRQQCILIPNRVLPFTALSLLLSVLTWSTPILVPCRYVAVFRAGLTAYTCIAILAVDFEYFPRRLAKAETFGTGLMDLGPGLYVFSFGLMLGLRIERSRQRAALSASHQLAKAAHDIQVAKGPDDSNDRLSLLLRALLSVGPLAALGAARLVLTKAVEYQVCHLSADR